VSLFSFYSLISLMQFFVLVFRVIRMLSSILLGDEKQNVVNKKRFYDDYGGDHISVSQKRSRPEDFEQTFTGNIDDDFKIGITVTKKSLKVRMYSLGINLA